MMIVVGSDVHMPQQKQQACFVIAWWKHSASCSLSIRIHVVLMYREGASSSIPIGYSLPAIANCLLGVTMATRMSENGSLRHPG